MCPTFSYGPTGSVLLAKWRQHLQPSWKTDGSQRGAGHCRGAACGQGNSRCVRARWRRQDHRPLRRPPPWRHAIRVVKCSSSRWTRLGASGKRSGSSQAAGGVERVPAQSLYQRRHCAPRRALGASCSTPRQSWDALVARHAPDGATAQRILDNPIYQNISGRFVQSHDYIAVERLYELHSEGSYDLIVVDTPPTRNAIDFLLAPQRMAEFFSSRLLRLLTVPYRMPLRRHRLEAVLLCRRPGPRFAVPPGHR
jgi:hypothetical protein